MAVNVSPEYREIIYSGGALHRATLTINGIAIENENIKKITISSPIIDKTQDYFYIGTFLAQKIEIQFRNADEIDLNGDVFLTISTQVREPSGNPEDDDYDDGLEDVLIGEFVIDTTPEDYYNNSHITCYDKSILFKQNVDISQWFEEEEYIDANGETQTRKTTITAENLLIALCTHFLGENKLGSYPQINKDVRTGLYDNTKSGKYYISKIAEIMGANAKIGRDGKLYLIPLNQQPVVTINALASKSWSLSSKYKISRVYWENGDLIFEKGNENDNSLNIDINNIFMGGNEENLQSIIDNLYDELNGFEMYSLKIENYGDVSLDCWDLINFSLGEENYVALNDNDITFEMNIASIINPTIPSKQKQQVTNVVGNPAKIVNMMRTEIDQVNNRVIQTNERVSEVQSDIEQNVYTKEQTNQLIRDAEYGLTNIFTKSGGNNLLTNTAPYRVVSERTLESWNGDINTINESDSVTGTALKLLQGIASQSVDVSPSIYAVGFKYKRLLDGATLKIEYNGRIIEIDNEDNITYNDDTNLTNQNGEITSFGEIVGKTFEISFDCSTDGGFEIYELRLVHGDMALPWTQNQNELKSKYVNIGDGITIQSEQANTTNKLDTNGMVVFNTTTNKEVLRATDEGITTEDLTSKGKSNLSGMIIQRVNTSHVFVTGLK